MKSYSQMNMLYIIWYPERPIFLDTVAGNIDIDIDVDIDIITSSVLEIAESKCLESLQMANMFSSLYLC